MEFKFIKGISMYYEAAEFLAKMMALALVELNSLVESYDGPDKELIEAKLENMHFVANNVNAGSSSFLLDAMELYAKLIKREAGQDVGAETAERVA